jgi:hypothetical protein
MTKGEAKIQYSPHLSERKLREAYFERFLSQIAPQACGCWEWMGCVDDREGKGYGFFQDYDPIRRWKLKRAHRYAFEKMVIPIPKGWELHHICFNRRCVNPDHLRLMTHASHSSMKKSRTWKWRQKQI